MSQARNQPPSPCNLSSNSCRCQIARSVRNGKQRLSPSDVGSKLSPGATEVLKLEAFVQPEGAEWIFLVTGHSVRWGRRDTTSVPPA